MLHTPSDHRLHTPSVRPQTAYPISQTTSYLPLQTKGCTTLWAAYPFRPQAAYPFRPQAVYPYGLHTTSDHRLHYHIFYTFRPKATDPSRPQSTLLSILFLQTKGYRSLQTSVYIIIYFIPSNQRLQIPPDLSLHYYLFYSFRPKATDPSRPQSTLLSILFLQTKGYLPNPFNQTIGSMSLLSPIAQPIPPRVKTSKQVLAR